jgi:hypothetical protein
LRDQKIVEGGIAKSRIATSKKTRELPLRAAASSILPLSIGSTQLSAPSLPEKPVFAEAPGAEADSSSSSIFPMTGIAGRLIQYGHNYVDSFRFVSFLFMFSTNGDDVSSTQMDTKVPTEKLTVNLECPPNPYQGPSVIQKTTQEREDTSKISVFPIKVIADSLIQHRRKYTNTYLCVSLCSILFRPTGLDF